MNPSPKTFPWELARQRIEQAEQSLIQLSRNEADIARMLRERAERLAKATSLVEPLEEDGPVAIFRLGESRFGVPLSGVAEVTAGAKIAAAPGTRPHIAGLVQVRGEVRVVVNLRILLGLPSAASDGDTVLFLRWNGGYLGLQVTEVEDIRIIPPAARRAAPPEAPCAAWMAEDLTIVLDTAAIFSRAIEES